MPILNWRRRINNSQGRLQGIQGDLKSKRGRGVPVENEVMTSSPCLCFCIIWGPQDAWSVYGTRCCKKLVCSGQLVPHPLPLYY